MLGFIADKLMFPGVPFKADKDQRQSVLFFENPESDKVMLYSHGNCASISLITESCLLYTSPSPRDQRGSRMPSSA